MNNIEYVSRYVLADRICNMRHKDFQTGITGWAFTFNEQHFFVAACVTCRQEAQTIWDAYSGENLEGS